MPAAVVKADIANIPFVGPLGYQTGCLYFDRADKNEKRDLLAMTKERQMLAEKGEFPPLIICAEGGTSNGKQLIAFKKGCFVGLRAI